MTIKQPTTSVLADVEAVLQSGAADRIVQEFRFDTQAQNQLLFFIKPEVFLLPTLDQTLDVCRLMIGTFEELGAVTSGAYMISGATLEQHRTMDAHYGYINTMSRRASELLTDQDRSEMTKSLGGIQGPVLGGHEVLARHPGIGAQALNQTWSQKKSLKLRSGFYFQAFDVEGQEIVMVNGFHPSQLEHFTAGGRKLLLILLNSDLPWRVLRSRMLGDTFPEKAHPASIRGTLYRNARRYGYEAVNITNNSAHLSAGPFEAAFECQNFLSKLASSFSVSSLRLATHFKTAGLSPAALERAITNPSARIGADPSATPLFEVTEECDSIAAVAAYRAFYA